MMVRQQGYLRNTPIHSRQQQPSLKLKLISTTRALDDEAGLAMSMVKNGDKAGNGTLTLTERHRFRRKMQGGNVPTLDENTPSGAIHGYYQNIEAMEL